MTIAHTRRKKSNTTPRSNHIQQRRHILHREISSKFRRQRALILQIFLHSRNQQPDENKPKQQQYIETTRLRLKKRTPTYNENPVKSNKKVHTTLHKNKTQTPRPCSFACHIRHCWQTKFYKSYIIYIYDENSTYQKNRKNTPPQSFHLNKEDLSN